MSNMKTLTIGDVTYTIYDEAVRGDIEQLRNDVAGKASVFTVTFSHGSSGGIVVDKTNAQINEAANAGMIVIGIDTTGRMMHLYRYGSTFAWFTTLGYDNDDGILMQVYRIENDSVIVESEDEKFIQRVINALPVYGGEVQ